MPSKQRLGPAAAALKKFEVDWAKSFGDDLPLIEAKVRPYEVVSTGSLELDLAMGCGGYVVGRITEIHGPEGTAKTTMGQVAVANFQLAYPQRMAGWIDMERTFDDSWAEGHGVNLHRSVFRRTRPKTAEDVADMTVKMISSGLFSVVVLDSVGGMVSDAEMGKKADEATVAAVARVVTRLVKQSAVMGDDHRTSLIIINQARANIGGGPKAGTTTTGGFALKHVSTHKLRNRRTGNNVYMLGNGKDEREVGFELAVTVEKNKVAQPRRVATFNLFNADTDDYGPIGIDRASEALSLGPRFGIVERAGSYYRFPNPAGGDTVQVQGEKKSLNLLRADPELVDYIRARVLEAKGAAVEELEDVAADAELETGTEDDGFVTGGGDAAKMVDFDPDVLARAHSPLPVSS
jgi:recombination protein RecA